MTFSPISPMKLLRLLLLAATSMLVCACAPQLQVTYTAGHGKTGQIRFVHKASAKPKVICEVDGNKLGEFGGSNELSKDDVTIGHHKVGVRTKGFGGRATAAVDLASPAHQNATVEIYAR